MAEPDGLPSMGSHRVGHDCSDLAVAAAGGTSGTEPTCQCRRHKMWVQSLGQEDLLEGHGDPLQYSCLENPMDKRAWWVSVDGVHRVGHGGSDLAHTYIMAFSVTTAISKAVCEHMFSFFLVEYPGIEFLCYIVDAYLTF